jgi:hypothetical protein
MKPHHADQLRTLVEAYVAGELTAEQRALLEARLQAEEEARLFLLGYLEVHAGLAWEFRGADRSVPDLTGQAAPPISEDAASVRRVGSVRPDSHKRRLRWIAVIAAAGALAVAAGLWQYEYGTAGSSCVVAMVKTNLDGQWADGREVVEGTPLRAGAWELQSGLVELEVASGTLLLIEAPASFELLDTGHARLLAGSLVVRMPKGTWGFVVEMPQMRVTDLGTEFGTSVASDGESRVQVFDGKVRAESCGIRGRRDLMAGEALASTEAGGLTSLAFRENRFIRCFPPVKPRQRGGFPLYNQSGLDTVYVAPAPAKIQIDGDLSDWNRAGAFRAACTPPYDQTYFVEAMMMYDAENLYLGAHVADPEPMRNTALDEKAEYAGGSVIVRVSTDRALGWPLKGTRLDSRGRLLPNIRNPESISSRVVHMTMWYDAAAARPRLQLFYGFDFHGTTSDPPGWQGAFRKDPDGRGYTLEYAIPWRLLNCAADPPRAGDALAAVWTVHWSDADGRVCRGYLVEVTNHGPTGQPRYSYQHGPSWGRAIYLPKE